MFWTALVVRESKSYTKIPTLKKNFLPHSNASCTILLCSGEKQILLAVLFIFASSFLQFLDFQRNVQSVVFLVFFFGLSQKTNAHLKIYWVTASELHKSGENADETVGLHGFKL